MPAIKITSNGTITLPAQIRKALGLKPGDFVNAELERGHVVLKPTKIIDAEDAWFYSKTWQKGEAEVDKELAKGEIMGPFSTLDDLFKELDK